jgi:hypothetical protein
MPRYCLCPYPLYQGGKCVYCGDESGESTEPKEIEQSRVAFRRSGTCICKIADPGPDGFCRKCRREFFMVKDVDAGYASENSNATRGGAKNEEAESGSEAQAGWYPDPSTGELKYFDGMKWLNIPAPNSDSKTTTSDPGKQIGKAAKATELNRATPAIKLDPVGDRYGFIGSYSICGSCGSTNKNSAVCTNCGHQLNKKEEGYKSPINPTQSMAGYLDTKPEPEKKQLKSLMFFGLIILIIILGIQFSGNSNPQSPANTGSGGDGRWIEKCRWVQVPNPAYRPAPPGISITEGLTYDNRRTVTEQRCTDVYVND